jgi:hypothetical protein
VVVLPPVENSRETVENWAESGEKLWNQWGKVSAIIRNVKHEREETAESFTRRLFQGFLAGFSSGTS